MDGLIYLAWNGFLGKVTTSSGRYTVEAIEKLEELAALGAPQAVELLANIVGYLG